MASWYGEPFHGQTSASGEVFDMGGLTAAHRRLPFGTILRVTNLENGRSVVVRVNDRGPYLGARILDLSRAAARQLRIIREGSARVRLDLLDQKMKASGAWRYLVWPPAESQPLLLHAMAASQQVAAD